MTLPRRFLGTLTVLAFAGLTACGTTAPASAPAVATSPSPSTAPTPSSPVVAPPTRRPASPPPSPRPSGGNGDSQAQHPPATAGGGICADLAAADIGAALGAPVTGSALPGGGCTFTQSDDRRPAASIVEASFAATPGGMAGAKNEATSSVEGDPVDLSGIGDAAFVVTGTAFGGPDLQGAGAVRVGDRLIRVNVNQSSGLSRAKVKALVIDLLKLVAAKA